MPVQSIQSLTDLWLVVPSKDLVLWTLHTPDERCPNCRKVRNANDMIYMDPYGSPSAACWYCAPQSQTCKDMGIATALRESALYIDSICEAVNPARWKIKAPKAISATVAIGTTFTLADKRQLVSEAAAKSILRCIRENRPKDVHYTSSDIVECSGTYSRKFMGDYGDVSKPYIDSHAECPYHINEKRGCRSMFSAMGTTCTKCIRRRCSRDDFTRSKMLDIKMRQRLACEGLRYAVWLSQREKYLIPNMWPGGATDPVRIPWVDWLTGDIVSTANAVDCIPLVEEHRRVLCRF